MEHNLYAVVSGCCKRGLNTIKADKVHIVQLYCGSFLETADEAEQLDLIELKDLGARCSPWKLQMKSTI
jgi:hypothetical protein